MMFSLVLSVLVLSACAQIEKEDIEEFISKLKVCHDGKSFLIDEKSVGSIDFSKCVLQSYGCISCNGQWDFTECKKNVFMNTILRGCKTDMVGQVTDEAYDVIYCALTKLKIKEKA